MNSWQAGMRLEALDRKTPTLICVATVGKKTSLLIDLTVYSRCWNVSEMYFYIASCTQFNHCLCYT